MRLAICSLQGIEPTETLIDLKRVQNFGQIFDFIESTNLCLFQRLQQRKFAFVLLKDMESKPILLEEGMNVASLEKYEFLFLVEEVRGEAVFTILVSTISAFLVTAFGISTAALAAGTFAALAVAVVSNVLAAAVILGVTYGIGQLISALSPNASPSSNGYGKSLLFNDTPNIQTQGSVVPWFIGECTGGGVIIARVINTYDFVVGDSTDVPELPDSISTITKASLASADESRWYKLLP